MNKSIEIIKSKIKKFLFSLDYLPRWMVFFMDVFLTISSSVISYLIVRSFNVKFYDTIDIPTRYSIIILIYILYFVFFKTFSGILRFSTFIDGLKLLYATICTFCTLVVINFVSDYFIGKEIYLFPSLIINCTITFSILFLFRIFVKIIFENFSTITKNSELLKAVVYGSDANAISVVTALQTEKTRRFQIIGFIEIHVNGNS